MKKIAALIGAGALLLSVATPAFAWWWGGSRDTAIVTNSAIATADTGLNSQGNYVVAGDDVRGGVNVSGNNSLTTGEASATATAVVVANTHKECCPSPCIGYACGGGFGGGSNRCECPHTDYANVNNGASAGAFTSGNFQGNSVEAGEDVGSRCGGGSTYVSGSNTMRTGDASSTARAWTVVNTHVAF